MGGGRREEGMMGEEGQRKVTPEKIRLRHTGAML